jgi:hypothetical protein
MNHTHGRAIIVFNKQFDNQQMKFLLQGDNYAFYYTEVKLVSSQSYDIFWTFLSKLSYFPNKWIYKVKWTIDTNNISSFNKIIPVVLSKEIRDKDIVIELSDKNNSDLASKLEYSDYSQYPDFEYNNARMLHIYEEGLVSKDIIENMDGTFYELMTIPSILQQMESEKMILKQTLLQHLYALDISISPEINKIANSVHNISAWLPYLISQHSFGEYYFYTSKFWASNIIHVLDFIWTNNDIIKNAKVYIEGHPELDKNSAKIKLTNVDFWYYSTKDEKLKQVSVKFLNTQCNVTDFKKNRDVVVFNKFYFIVFQNASYVKTVDKSFKSAFRKCCLSRGLKNPLKFFFATKFTNNLINKKIDDMIIEQRINKDCQITIIKIERNNDNLIETLSKLVSNITRKNEIQLTILEEAKFNFTDYQSLIDIIRDK